MAPRNVVDYFGTGSDAGDHSFLSNFYEDGGTTVEHHYQAAKTDDPTWVKRIMSAATPNEAKKIGRQRSLPLRPTWEQEKVAVMRTLLRVKFRRPHLRRALLATGDAELIEGNWWGDTFWGVCKGEGQNQLGKLLMAVRDEVRDTDG